MSVTSYVSTNCDLGWATLTKLCFFIYKLKELPLDYLVSFTSDPVHFYDLKIVCLEIKIYGKNEKRMNVEHIE